MELDIGGETWTIEEAELCGMCDREEHLIPIASNLTPKWRLETLIHELLHAAVPGLSEDEVEHLDRILQEGLWADGWRRPNPRKRKN